MPKLAGTLPVHVAAPGYDTTTIWPGDDIPEWALEQLEPALKGEADAPAEATNPGSSGAGPEALTEEQLRELNVPDLKARLGQYNPPVEFAGNARKDDLVELALKAQQPAGD